MAVAHSYCNKLLILFMIHLVSLLFGISPTTCYTLVTSLADGIL